MEPAVSRDHLGRFAEGHKTNIGRYQSQEYIERHKNKLISNLGQYALKNAIPWNKNKRGLQIAWNKNKKLAKLSEIHKERISQSLIGENHWNWKNGSSLEPYNKDFFLIKYLIRQIYTFECQDCHIIENGKRHCIHHMDFDKQNNSLSNLNLLCVSCHMKLHNKEKYGA